jgi:hypothetical protein
MIIKHPGVSKWDGQRRGSNQFPICIYINIYTYPFICTHLCISIYIYNHQWLGISEWDGQGRGSNQYPNGLLLVTHTGYFYIYKYTYINIYVYICIYIYIYVCIFSKSLIFLLTRKIFYARNLIIHEASSCMYIYI